MSPTCTGAGSPMSAPRPGARPEPRATLPGAGSTAAQFSAMLARYSPPVAACARGVLARLRRQVPGAVELVYDNYNALVVGFGASERASEAVLSVALYPRWVTLFFLDGRALRDPGGLLEGDGKLVRRIMLAAAADLDRPAVRALVRQAVRAADPPIDARGKRRMVIRAVSKQQRPRSPR